MNYLIDDISYDEDSILEYAKSLVNSAQEWQKELGDFLLQWFNEDSTIEVNTSGSTGDPKRILLHKSAMVESAKLTANFFQIKKNSNVLLGLPVKYIAGKMVVIRSLVNGWNLITVQPSSNPLRELTKKIHFTSFTPMQVSEILLNDGDKLGEIDKVLIGGAALHPNLEQRLSSCTNEIFVTYGMTETITHVAVRKLNSENVFFQALPGVEFEVDDQSCLVIRAPHIEREVRTNDIVLLHNKTEFELLGRRDNVINSGGLKIHPEKVEEVISKDIVQPFFIIGKRDEVLGERVVMYVEGKTLQADQISNLIELWKKSLDGFTIPKEIFSVEQFDRTSTDKIIRRHYDGNKLYGKD